ncbi:MAG: hypothetical protein AAF557_10135 [Pseudomonadota bacterium]
MAEDSDYNNRIGTMDIPVFEAPKLEPEFLKREAYFEGLAQQFLGESPSRVEAYFACQSLKGAEAQETCKLKLLRPFLDQESVALSPVEEISFLGAVNTFLNDYITRETGDD